MNQKVILTFVAFVAIQSFLGTSVFAQADDQNGSDDETGISLDLPSIFPIVRMIKGQIKEIVIDLAMQVFQFVRAVAQDIKVRLLKRLGKYTLSDCFHLIFDGVIEIVEEGTPESNISELAEPTNMATTMTTTEEPTTKMATTEKTTTESTTTTTEKITTAASEESKENENEPENTRSVFFQNPYLWYYK